MKILLILSTIRLFIFIFASQNKIKTQKIFWRMLGTRQHLTRWLFMIWTKNRHFSKHLLSPSWQTLSNTYITNTCLHSSCSGYQCAVDLLRAVFLWARRDLWVHAVLLQDSRSRDGSAQHVHAGAAQLSSVRGTDRRPSAAHGSHSAGALVHSSHNLTENVMTFTVDISLHTPFKTAGL